MPNPDGGTMTGRSGHGYAKITCVSKQINSIDTIITPLYDDVCLKVDGQSGESVVASSPLTFDNGATMGDHLLHFQAKSTNSATIQVGTIEGGAFVAIDSVTPMESNRWEDMVVWLRHYTGAGDQLAFRSVNSVNYIDNVWMEITDTNACAFPPMGLQALNVTGTSATLTWESSSAAETSYTLEWGLGDFVQGQGNSTIINNLADTFYQLTNLLPG